MPNGIPAHNVKCQSPNSKGMPNDKVQNSIAMDEAFFLKII